MLRILNVVLFTQEVIPPLVLSPSLDEFLTRMVEWHSIYRWWGTVRNPDIPLANRWHVSHCQTWSVMILCFGAKRKLYSWPDDFSPVFLLILQRGSRKLCTLCFFRVYLHILIRNCLTIWLSNCALAFWGSSLGNCAELSFFGQRGQRSRWCSSKFCLLQNNFESLLINPFCLFFRGFVFSMQIKWHAEAIRQLSSISLW